MFVFCRYSIGSIIFLFIGIINSFGQDTLKSGSASYTGYRIELTQIVKKSSATASGQNYTATVINSGKFTVALGKPNESNKKLQVLVDDNPLFDNNPALKEELIKSILKQELTLAPGQLFREIKLYGGKTQTNTNTLSDNKQSELKTEKATKKNKKNKKIAVPEPIVDAEVKKDIPVTVDTAHTKTAVDATRLCPDLIISDVKFVKQTKNSMIVECTIVNQGKQEAPIHGYKKNGIENISLAAYFSASSKLSRGSILAGGHVIKKGLESTNGNLLPGASMIVKFEVSLQDKSRYLNSLIISADSRQLIYECNEANNNLSILLK